MTQKDFDTEDTVICLDVSRSMARRDFNPSRLEAVKNALVSFIEIKNDIDKDDRFALVTFSTNAKIVQELTNNPEQIINAIKSVSPQGISSLGEGLAVALHVVSDQILKQGSNINRVIVISDGKPWLGTIDPLEKARIMGEVGVLVDALEISASRATWGHNILESVSIIGDYHQATNENMLMMILRTLSHKKDVFELKKTMPKLHLIAADLLNPNELTDEILDAIKHISKIEEEKCIICRMDSCGICETPDCGRLCPYCKTYMHLCCAKKWSEESKMVEASVFRCPHCLFLLKLPEEVTTRIPIKKKGKPKGVQAVESSSKAEESEGIKASKFGAKVGDFFLEHGQVKLVADLADEKKELYLSWENWGSRDFNCNIVSGMNEIICKELIPKIDWVDRTCSGFILRDVLGWFSKPNIDRGIFLLDLIQFENWCKVVLADIQQIKEVIARHPEIKVESDKLIDFEFIIDVNYKSPIDTTDRNKLDQRLLEDVVRYLQLLRNRPYSKISIDKRLDIPKAPIETSAILEPAQPAETAESLPSATSIVQEPTPPSPSPREEPPIVSIENPYTGKTVEIPTLVSKEADIGTARTLAVPKKPKRGRKKKIEELPQIETIIQKFEEKQQKITPEVPQKPLERVKLRCASCQVWFEVEKFSQFPCPHCNKPLKLAIQCKKCKNWFSVSKPGKYNCPKCKELIDASHY
ncbi:MAG: VWA domain-containing protein [Candidatus Helarchaeota archaeon]|nr:VWA domain-containing protein [Candidatus Helarchaeota archaeon]